MKGTFRIGFLLLAISIIYVKLKPLSPEVLKFLEKDIETYKSYRADFGLLSCRLLTYSRLKYMYEKELLDAYVTKAENKAEYLEALIAAMIKQCQEKNTDVGKIFEANYYVGYDESLADLTDVNFTQILANYTAVKKEDL